MHLQSFLPSTYMTPPYTACNWCLVILREIKQGSPVGYDHASLDTMWKVLFPLQEKDKNPRSRSREFTAAPQPLGTPQPYKAASRHMPRGFVTCNLPRLGKWQEWERKATPAMAAHGCSPAWCFQLRQVWPAPVPPAQPPQHCSAAKIAPPRTKNPRETDLFPQL